MAVAKKSLFQISLPTKAQLIDVVEWALVAFVSAFVGVWVKQPKPFSVVGVSAALAAAVAVIVAGAKGFLTTL